MTTKKQGFLKETLDILSNPELMKAIRKGEKELREGRGISWEEAKKNLGWKI